MSKWRRPATKTYDYNYRLGEHYYKPQLSYLDTRKGRAKTPPAAKTFAERIAEDPIYGNYGGANMRRTAFEDGLGEGAGAPGMTRFASMDDMNLGRRPTFQDFDSGAFSPSSPRLVVGDRLLDSVGISEGKLSQPLALTFRGSSQSKLQSSEGAEESSFSRKRVGFRTAQADLMTEDPIKSRFNAKLQAARKQADSMMDEMKTESDSTVSRFRAKIQARKEEQLNRREQMSSNFGFGDDDEDAALRSRINQIGERARARLANLDDDFPELQISSSLASRRGMASSEAEDDSRATSRTLKISKRTIKSSYDVE